MKKLFYILSFGLLLISCTDEIARIDLIKNSSPSISIECKKHRQIDFYLDADMEFVNKPVMVMDFEFYKGDEQILKGGLDPLEGDADENETINNNGILHSKFYKKLEGNFIPPSDTIFTIKPTLIYNQHPDLKINKFELVLVR